MTSQPGQQIITIHKLFNIARNRANQTMKFGQLIEYNVRDFFREKSYTNCGRPFYKKSKLNKSVDQQSEIL